MVTVVRRTIHYIYTRRMLEHFGASGSEYWCVRFCPALLALRRANRTVPPPFLELFPWPLLYALAPKDLWGLSYLAVRGYLLQRSNSFLAHAVQCMQYSNVTPPIKHVGTEHAHKRRAVPSIQTDNIPVEMTT